MRVLSKLYNSGHTPAWRSGYMAGIADQSDGIAHVDRANGKGTEYLAGYLEGLNDEAWHRDVQQRLGCCV